MGPEATLDQLRTILEPQSIAVVGASESASYGGRFLFNLIQGGYKGEIYPVNPKYSSLQGLNCFPVVKSLPKPVDTVAIMVARHLVLPTLEECYQKGIRSAIIVSAGFAEADSEGRELQERLRNFCLEKNFRVCGPNCLGITNVRQRIQANSFSYQEIPIGSIGLISQSGALAFSGIVGQAIDRGIGFSYVISSGNEADLEASDYMDFLVEDPHTRVIAGFIEGFKRSANLLRVAAKAREKGKPIVILKIGRSAMGTRVARSHTGSLTGSDEVYSGLFKQTGLIRMDFPDDLLEMAALLAHGVYPGQEGLAVLSTSGGLGGLIADRCGQLEIALPELDVAISKEISQYTLAFDDLSNPVDIRGQGAAHLPRILKPLLAEERYGVILIALALPAVGQLAIKIATDIVDIAKRSLKRLVVLWIGTRETQNPQDSGFKVLEKNDVPVYTSPERCLRSLQGLFIYQRFLKNRRHF